MPSGTENHIGDVRDRMLMRKLIRRCDIVIHLASAVGVGQSMYKIEHYCSVNVMGTAALLEEILLASGKIKKLVVASSMSIYGEGDFVNREGKRVPPTSRSVKKMQASEWELYDQDENELTPVPVKEGKSLNPASVYAINKRDQEEMCLAFGRAYGIPTVAFRMFNVFGARQALGNPYTGVAAIFSAKLLNDEAPTVFEDGNQKRDFVHVEDVARAYAISLTTSSADGMALNLGSGEPVSVFEIATILAEKLGKSDIVPTITGKYRDGDVRHCFAVISLIKEKLNWNPRYIFRNGVDTMLEWLLSQKGMKAMEDSFGELERMGILK